MKNPTVCRQALADDQTANFDASLPVTKPTFLDIEVTAPGTRRNGTIKAQTQTRLVLGKDILRDGIVAEIPSYVLDILTPTTHEVTQLDALSGRELVIKASLTMTYGCPFTKGGL